jgi:DNA topoisomerase-2
LVANPTFDSQTKDSLTNRKQCFKNECSLSDKFLKQVSKSDIVENILAFAKYKQNRELGKSSGKKKIKLTGIQKLDDANRAGSKDSLKCTLILTEGDSAKSLAMSGLSVIGRDYYGVYPLKGKPLNVRDATHAQVMKNEEIKNVIDILGLKHGVQYDEENIKTLRYGHLMIMADQDHDGSHIKGLIINFIHHFWPTLLDVPGFLQQFITPIVKCTKGKKSETFFTLPQYENWREDTGNNAKGWKIKYYKGLGTSTSADAKEYFSNLDLHEIDFSKLSLDVKNEDDDEDEKMEDVNPPDAEQEVKPVPDSVLSNGATLIDLVFSKKRANDRKGWLQTYEKDTFLDYSSAQQEGVKYSQFINEEFILFSKADNARSIPHVMDGFKPSQRKVLFSCFKRKLKDEIKVAQLSGYIGEHSAYHHGEMSLHTTIINMAQSFVGSNNINLLTPSGQFGTRRMGGKDAASPRYIFTMLEKITRAIFHPDDDELLNYLSDDGASIEPEFFVPVIPMVLVNGSDGIGTGWSSKIPNYNPRQIIENIRRKIKGEELEAMHPFYSGFTGEIIQETKDKYICKGIVERIDDTTVSISELPVRFWTQDCKNNLEKMLLPAGDNPAEVKDFTENHTDTTVSFNITASRETVDKWERTPKGGLIAKFKLSSSINTSNMHLFDIEDKISKYEKPEDILEIFFDQRMEFYVKRKEMLVKKLRKEQTMLSNKARFVEEVCSGELVVSNRKKIELLKDLQSRGYDLFDKNATDSDDSEDDDEDEDDTSVSELSKGYEYLLGMKLWALTFEKAEQLRKLLAERTEELKELEAIEPSQIWLNDLDSIDIALDERDAEIKRAEEDESKAQKKTAKRQATKAKKAAATKKRAQKKKDEWDSDLEDDCSSDEDMAFTVSNNKPAAKTKKAPAKAKKAPLKPKRAPAKGKKAPVTKPAVKAAAKKKESEEAMDVDIEIGKSDSMDTTESSGSGSKRPSPKAAEKKTTAKSKKQKKTPPPEDESEEEDFVIDDGDTESETEVAAPPPRSRRAARGNVKPTTYTYDDSDDDSEDSYEADSDGDESDF